MSVGPTYDEDHKNHDGFSQEWDQREAPLMAIINNSSSQMSYLDLLKQSAAMKDALQDR